MKETTDMEPVNSEIPTLSTIRTAEKYRILNDWKVKRLEEICTTFKSGQGITSSDIFETGPYAVYGGNGLRGFTNRYTHDGDYILIGRQGALCGNITFISGQNYVSEHAIAVQTDSENDIAFFSYKLESLNLNRFSESSAQPGLSVEKLVRRKIVIPPIIEQRAIASLLSTWDEAIQLNTQLIAQKELSKKWLMYNLLKGKKRLDGFDEVWPIEKMNDIFERVTTKNDEVNTNVVTISAQRGFVRQDDFFKKIVASDILDNYFLVKKGDFCYNKSYSNGYPWGATKRLNEFEKAVVTTLYICFRLRSNLRTSGDYFEYYFNTNLLDKGLMKIAHEGGRAHGLLNVTPNDFFELKITIPPLEEQIAIAKILRTAENELLFLKDKLEMLKEQKRGLMQILLTGKKRLKIH